MLSTSTVVILALAVYRLTFLLTSEEGPFDVFLLLREYVGIVDHPVIPNQQTATTFLGKVLMCGYCTSIWVSFGVALLFFLLGDVSLWMLLPFALSGFIVLLDNTKLSNGLF